jgi:lysophospholipase L1-like esterase
VILGDSLAFGLEASTPAHSYVGLIYRHELARFPGLQPASFACSGATTGSLFDGAPCDSVTGTKTGGSQLHQALVFLRAHRGQVAFLTIDIGLNDIDTCMTTTAFNAACTQRGLDQVAHQLPEILGALAAADPGVPIIGMNYYDPFLAAWLTGPSGPALARQTLASVTALNRTVAHADAGIHATTADVAGAFDSSDFTPAPGATTPRNVATICADTSVCARSDDIHPNDTGYATIASAFDPGLSRLRPSVAPPSTHPLVWAGVAVVAAVCFGVLVDRRRRRSRPPVGPDARSFGP